MTENITLAFSLFTIIGQILLAVLVLYFLIKKNQPEIFKRNALWFSFFISLTAMLGSLFYSEIAGYEPCVLCWYQRILMYPQTFIIFLALIKKEGKKIADYVITLSAIGSVIAAFNYYLQAKGAGSFACSTVGYSIDCSETFFMTFGYITIPLMALTAFLLIIVSMFSLKIKEK
ncbi:MAG: disulfide bond formation protein B [Candidatus Pacebacteria bacterium]|nr:disulfide bond formation protein B [Candidatus Paceibacterota bacterium]